MHLVMVDIFDGDDPVESRVLYGSTKEEAEERFARACARDPLLDGALNRGGYEGRALRVEGRHVELPNEQVPALRETGTLPGA